MDIFILILLIFVITILIRSCVRPKHFPPGPRFFPIIGSWYIVPPNGIEYKISAWRKKYGNIIGNKIGSRYLVIVTGFEEIISGLKHPNFQKRIRSETLTARSFSKRLGLLFNDGDQWQELKRFTLHYFSQICNKYVEEIMHDEMLEWFSSIQPGKVIEVNSKFTEVSVNTVFSLLAGNRKNDFRVEIDAMRDLTNRAFAVGRITGLEIFYPITRIFFGAATKANVRSFMYIHNVFSKCLENHKATFDGTNLKDYIDAYLLKQMQEKELTTSGHFTDEQLLACMLDLLQASSESNANSMSFMLLYVALNSHVQDKIFEELDRVIGRNRNPTLEDRPNLPYCEAVLYEVLRINPVSGIGGGHIVSEDTKFYGYLIPKDTLLFFAHDNLFMDSNIYPDPNAFKPERFLTKEAKMKLTAFGLGKRACPGEFFSKNFLFLFLAYFFQKYRIALPEEFKNPNLDPIHGFINSPRPFKLLINERS